MNRSLNHSQEHLFPDNWQLTGVVTDHGHSFHVMHPKPWAVQGPQSRKCDMYESPASLEELCLESICDNILNVFELYCENGESQQQRNNGAEDDSESDNGFSVLKKRFRFRDKDIFLFNEISERLLEKLCDRGLLCDSTLSLFNEKNTRLKSVRIRNCKKVTPEGLKVLKKHKITDLECVNLTKVNRREILGEWPLWGTTRVNNKWQLLETIGSYV